MIEKVLQQLKALELQLGTAESCTGGWLAKVITDVPGSSSVYWGGFNVYHNQAKIQLLGVSEDLLKKYGAVSREVVEALLTGIFDRTPVDIAVSVSGIAGPGGGSEDKPVGTVWMAAARRGEKIHSLKKNFSGDRDAVRRQAVEFLLGMIKDLTA